ncbi:5-(carboxyamino)imidazole ribonucleotide synthase [Oricola cellulosilytica]|uniref:N5-carboxyaminoimidazole ribonucleotide synthase n=1 Tax=Oricola cellulosilytica TaxID=1429082 RepID=A0A4R0P4C8_9HYPH|nr:5-(carboxyamino)imidazole ribonucleotide synthase [Oricola cellulosilytica]TCD11436.1 5-(carboxyamino)imidazole ribonucleotide synthase [Oricola cellulosilytica]
MTLARGATIGIVGGGQLGRMLAIAAARLGFRTCVLDPAENCPAAQTCNEHIAAAYDDMTALAQLARRCDAITYEFENIALGAARWLEKNAVLRPGATALETAQDRLIEKTFLNANGIPTVGFRDVADAASLADALAAFGGRGILKTRRLGYDGKGQIRFRGAAGDPSPEEALGEIGHAPAILEAFAPFEGEISVIVTRGGDGTTVCYEPARNVHAEGILSTSTVPAGIAEPVGEQAVRTAAKLADALSYVGTLGLELFVMADGTLRANEFAPRVHNSGHWTEAACAVSQFEQHIRAVAGWPLGAPDRHSDCVMENLIGDDIGRMPELARAPNVVLHDYGKAESRPGRKMGHFTRLRPRLG